MQFTRKVLFAALIEVNQFFSRIYFKTMFWTPPHPSPPLPYKGEGIGFLSFASMGGDEIIFLERGGGGGGGVELK